MPSNKLRIPQFDYKSRNLFLISCKNCTKKRREKSSRLSSLVSRIILQDSCTLEDIVNILEIVLQGEARIQLLASEF